MATWDARGWLAAMGCERNDLAIRSIHHHGPKETPVRYERGAEAVARLAGTGPIPPWGQPAETGDWRIFAPISPGTEDAHAIDVPEADEITCQRVRHNHEHATRIGAQIPQV